MLLIILLGVFLRVWALKGVQEPSRHTPIQNSREYSPPPPPPLPGKSAGEKAFMGGFNLKTHQFLNFFSWPRLNSKPWQSIHVYNA